jgi:hypothetical protein
MTTYRFSIPLNRFHPPLFSPCAICLSTLTTPTLTLALTPHHYHQNTQLPPQTPSHMSPPVAALQSETYKACRAIFCAMITRTRWLPCKRYGSFFSVYVSLLHPAFSDVSSRFSFASLSLFPISIFSSSFHRISFLFLWSCGRFFRELSVQFLISSSSYLRIFCFSGLISLH